VIRTAVHLVNEKERSSSRRPRVCCFARSELTEDLIFQRRDFPGRSLCDKCDTSRLPPLLARALLTAIPARVAAPLDHTSEMSVPDLRAELLDESVPIPRRFRSLFALRSIGGDASVDALLDGLKDPSALFRHEVAFALGQMQATRAVPKLKEVLEDASDHSMVRHEAAEALGAIASDECAEALRTASEDECQVVRETAVLALQRLKHAQSARADAAAAAAIAAAESETRAPPGEKLGSAKEKLSAGAEGGDAANGDSPYMSVDPVPAASSSISTETLTRVLLDESADTWDRYGAMFALRNRGPAPDVAAALGAVLASSSSALLKHEVCYVLGQIQEKGTAARDALRQTLMDASEHPMVRHEAAEALGSIAAADTESLLSTYCADADRIVAESCEVALDIMASEMSGEFVPLQKAVEA
jgi:deoxyhypusine monooxygenase